MKYISVLKRFNSVVESRNSSLKNEYKRLCENLEDGMEEEDPVDQIPVDEGAGNGEVDYDSFFAEDSTPVDDEVQLDEEDDMTEIPASEVFNQKAPVEGSVAEGDEMVADVDGDPEADGLSEDSIEVVDDEVLEGGDCDDNISIEDPDGLMEDGDEGGEQSPEKVDDVAELFNDEGGDAGEGGESGDSGEGEESGEGEGSTDDGGETADVPNDNPEEKIEEVPSDDGKSEGDGNQEEGGKSEGGDAENGETSSDSGESSEGDDAGKGEGGEEKPKEEPKEEPKDDAGKEEKPKEEPKEDGGDEGGKEEVNEEFDPNAYFNDNPENDTQSSSTQDGLAEGEEPRMVPLSELTEQEGDSEENSDEFVAPVEGEPEGDEVTVDEDDDEPYDTLENPEEDDELDESVVQAFNLNRRLLKKR